MFLVHILDRIVQKWGATEIAYADNDLCMLVCEASLKKKPANIPHFFRIYMKRKVQKRSNGVAAKDPHYKAIFQRILHVKKAKEKGNLDHVLNVN